jgi:3-oxoacyl-[acyl-carrier protein] reductase
MTGVERGGPSKSVAIVTGGGRNIGRAVALALAQAGWDVAVIVRSRIDEANSVAEEIGSSGRTAAAWIADVADHVAVDGAFDEIRARLGPVGVLVNGAAVRQESEFLDLEPAQWRDTMAVNLDGAYHCCRAALPDMLAAGWGRIVNIAGLTGQIGASQRAHVVASKAGLIGLTKALALEFAGSNITVNCVSPGMIATRREGPDPAHHAEHRPPVGRLGRPEEVAAAVRYLASEEAGYVTGQVLGINGGLA